MTAAGTSKRKHRLVCLLLVAALAGNGWALQAAAQAVPAPTLAISGADDELAANIRAVLTITTEPCTTPLVRLQRLLPTARSQLDDAANALGYYHATFTTAFVIADNCWRLDIAAEPGPRVLLAGINIGVSGPAEVQALFADVLDTDALQSGQPLHHGRYEALKAALTARATDLGYLGARFERANIALDLLTDTADIDLQFDPGVRFHFGAIDVRQDGMLSAALIAGLLQVESGDIYDSTTLSALRRRLDNSQYFRQVRVTPQLVRLQQQEVPVAVDLELRPRHAWTSGLGFATDTGPRLRATYQNRYLTPDGHRLQGDLALSTVRTQLDGTYAIPLADPARQSLNFASGYSVEDNDSFESKRYKLETSVRNETSSGLLQTAFVAFQRDDYIVDVQQDVSLLTIAGISLNKTRADNPVNPTRGWKLFAQLQGASDVLLSDTSFMQFYSSAKHIMPLGNGRLLSRFELGATWAGLTTELPASLRYFAGGDQSLRGYDYRALGPLNANGEVSGGKQLIVGSVEYDHRVMDNWRLAAFLDSGNAFNTFNDFEWRHSVGIGLRWLSPIGPVRVDLARALDSGGGFRLHVTMGPDL
jgi:translocation and assembly module TamA